jgi:tRNA threonylcarbamoyladenosine biosynthesis protein TsaB
MLNLAIDTSSSKGTAALGNEKVISHAVEFGGQKRHSSTLYPALMQIGLPRLQLTRIIVGVGPGSFSGIRVSLATAQAIALVQQVPVVGICSAFSVAQQKKEVTRLGVFADAKRGELYCTIFERGELEKETFLLKRQEFEDVASKLTLAVSADPLLKVAEIVYPRAEDYLALPEDFPYWIEGPDLEPIYLREAVK